MKPYAKIFSILSLSLFCALGYSNASEHPHSTSRKIRLTIIQTTDTHACILPDQKTPGFLKLASTIRREIEKAGGKNSCLLVDCGDTLQGSLAGSLSKGSAGIIMLNELDYDAWIPGNHDFDFGYKRLEEIFKMAKPEILCLNMPQKAPSAIGWKIFTRNKMKIAIIGATYENSSFKNDKNADSLEMKLAKTMPEIMNARPDMIILAIHEGTGKSGANRTDISQIARTYPQINLVLGGHTHQEIPGQTISRSTWFVQAGHHASCAAVINVEFDDTDPKNAPTISSKLVFAQENDIEDAKCAKALDEIIEKTKIESDRVIGKVMTRVSFDVNDQEPASAQFTANAILEASSAEFAFAATQSENAALDGAVTENDLFDFSPYEDSVCTVELAPCEIRKIIAEQVQLKIKSQRMTPFNLNVKIRKNEIKLADKAGASLDESKKYRTAFTSYALSGAGGKYPTLRKISENPENNMTDTNIFVRQAISDFISENSPVNFNKKEWIVFEKH